ncbi:MAG: hypothetical protein PHP46_04220, partial [Candidatus Omnitrophica bacterium]|nr:hypothetical protein [Candidatus Omnitrophota bacterium]
MIDYYPGGHRRFLLKVIAAIMIVTFVWYDIAWAGDLFSFHPMPISTAKEKIDIEKDAQDVTNYDLLYYNKRKSAADKLLPTGKEKEQSQQFAPGYVQEQQEKHEDIIKQKQSGEEMMWQMQDALRRKLQKGEEEDWNLKKRRGGGGDKRQQGGQALKYTLSDYDEEGNPEKINIYDYNPDGSLKSITSYDIRGLDKSKWISKGQEIEDKEGKKFFGSFTEADMEGLTDDRILEKVIYTGSKGEERIDYVLSEYDEEGNPASVSMYDYNKDGNPENLDEVVTYDLEGLDIDFSKSKDGWEDLLTEDRVSRTAVYEGAKGEEKVIYVLDDYFIGEDGVNRAGEMSVYDYNNDEDEKNLDEVRTYDISELSNQDDWDQIRQELLSDDEAVLDKYKERLITVSEFSGAKGGERIEQTYYYEDGIIVERKDYEYEEYEAKYSEHKGRKLTNIYTFDVSGIASEEEKKKKSVIVRNADGTIDFANSELNGDLIGEDTFSGAGGHERIEQSFVYEDQTIVERKDYEYENGILKSLYTLDVVGEGTEAEKRRKSSIVRNADGTIDFLASDLNGNLAEEAVFGGGRGKEKIVESFSYQDGQIYERKEYNYEGKRLVSIKEYDVSLLESEALKRTRGEGEEASTSYFEGRAGHERLMRITDAAGISIFDLGDNAPIDPREIEEYINQPEKTDYSEYVDGEGYLHKTFIYDGVRYDFKYLKNADGTPSTNLAEIKITDPTAGTVFSINTYSYDTADPSLLKTITRTTPATAEAVTYTYKKEADGSVILTLVNFGTRYTSYYIYDTADRTKVARIIQFYGSPFVDGELSDDAKVRTETVFNTAFERIETVYIYEGDNVTYADLKDPAARSVTADDIRYTSVYSYTADNKDAALYKITQYEGADTNPASGVKKQETYYTATYGKGFEKADFSITYVHGTRLSLSKFYYGDGTVDSSLAGRYSRLANTIEYKWDSAVFEVLDTGASATFTIKADATPEKKSEIIYQGFRGKEKVDYIISYKNNVLYSRSDYEYAVDSDTGLDLVKQYKVTTQEEARTRGAGLLMAETRYIGFAGEEIADTSVSYKLFGTGAGTEVKTTSIFYYNNKRASDLTAIEIMSTAMNKSESYRGTSTATADRLSTTYFVGSKGDEVADYSESYML